MKPNQLGLMMHPENGRIFIVLKKPKTTTIVRDVTTDFVLMQAAEILAQEDGTEGIVREHVATDVYGNVLELEITARITRQSKVGDQQ